MAESEWQETEQLMKFTQNRPAKLKDFLMNQSICFKIHYRAYPRVLYLYYSMTDRKFNSKNV